MNSRAIADKETADSPPWLRIDPPVAPWSLVPGSVEVSWDSGTDDRWQVWLRRDSGASELFATGGRGRQRANWITEATHTFSLSPADKPEVVAASATTRMALRAAAERTRPFLRLTPNPLPRSQQTRNVHLEWDTGDGSAGRVTLETFDNPRGEQIQAGLGPAGSKDFDWIKPGRSYVFRLFRATNGIKPVVTVKMSPAGEGREMVLDLVALAGVLGSAPLAIALDVLRRMRRRTLQRS
ncbi:MAG: hypothetical protein ABI797_00630 [Chloroflexota bacterium]